MSEFGKFVRDPGLRRGGVAALQAGHHIVLRVAVRADQLCGEWVETFSASPAVPEIADGRNGLAVGTKISFAARRIAPPE